MTSLALRLGDHTVAARVDGGGQVTIDGATFTVTDAGRGLYLVTDGQRRWQVAVAEAGDQRWISVDGQVVVVSVEAAGRTVRKTSRASAGMTAPMPATVLKVLVEPGQAVKEGETVLVLEAMKMELPIRAPQAGVVKVVRCRQGEMVQPGEPLVELE